MILESILTPGRTECGVSVTSKKRLLEHIAAAISADNAEFDADELFNELLARERLGSTGLGHGVAIPHCRSNRCSSVTGMLLKLEQAIDFEAIDDEPVDLIFALIVPAEAHDEHLKVLSALATAFNETDYRNNLRTAEDANTLFKRSIVN
ncbi:Nitrogen regulatory protein [Zhongshania aliphaticivorans]|uniref:Nitrogen regulatory protein n=1 Tax=Zhongshania aliphaticivorans TaxID=1470434 RepID=A0A5S9N3K2_9GAMM|nr:PTS sugar transporter subunit IIA [Zhongshania aliphaticivorans]CAA0083352.1 Nitrogen regulatory protein [Zhongshania aliphaticivorans]CAA0083427.1 Nitrogen regulatory protein [Zhongshania aliphaticivorans]